MKTFLITFIILSIVNVVFSTVRSILTIKGGKIIASLVSGGYFAFYNIMMIYTVKDFSMWQKCLITFVCNVTGVFIVKLIEELLQKDKLWKVEATIHKQDKDIVCELLNKTKVPFNYIDNVDKWVIFNVYCSTKKQSATVKEILNAYNAKYFVSESKIL